jgi:photosystem II stability/assembly factor-like uncharacterized protein
MRLDRILASVLGVILLQLGAFSSGFKTPDEYKNDLFLQTGKHLEDHQGLKFMKRWNHRWGKSIVGDEFPDAIALYNFSKKSRKNESQLQTASKKWTVRGPLNPPSGANGIGRINVVRIHPDDSKILFVGTAGGGAWKSTNHGNSWTLLPTTDMLAAGISDIAISPSNPNVMYLGTGDANTVLGGNDYYSLGLLKSTDGGQSWNLTGLSYAIDDRRMVSSIAVHPGDENKLIAATSSGMAKSTDGGATWETTSDSRLAFKDVEMKFDEPEVMIASTIDRGGNARIYHSTDFGDTWERVVSLGNSVRIELDVSHSDSEKMYAVASQTYPYSFHSFLQSSDGGENWTTVADAINNKNILGRKSNGEPIGDNPNVSDQGFYDLCLAVSPKNSNEIIVGGVYTFATGNDGNNWTYVKMGAQSHADQHYLQYTENADTLYIANDGGLWRVPVSKGTPEFISRDMNISQFYRASISQQNEKIVIAGAQDNATFFNNGSYWQRKLGGDGMDCLINPSNDSYIFASLYYGSVALSTNKGNNFTYVMSESISGEKGAWVSPIAISESRPNVAYIGMDNVWRSTSYGNKGTWQKMTNFTSNMNFDFIAVAPSNNNYVYAGVGGSIYFTKNDWISYDKIPGVTGSVSRIAVDPKNPERIFVSKYGYSKTNKVWMYDGSEWTNLTGNLPNVSVRCIIYQKNSPDRIYIGNDLGVYYSDYNSGNWQRYGSDLPYVMVDDLEIQENTGKMIAATYGRGLWEVELLGCDEPAIQIEAKSDLLFCSSDSVEVSVVNPDDNLEYIWSDGQIGESVFIKSEGIISVKADVGNDCSVKSSAITTKYLPIPNSSFSSSAGDTICEGDSTKLSVSFGLKNFQWEDGSAENSRWVSEVGVYSLIVSNDDGCVSTTELELFTGNPDAPLIEFNDTILSTDAQANGYQWYLNDEIINGASSSTFKPTENGIYSLEARYFKSCRMFSNNIDVIVSSLKEEIESNLHISPNPSDGIFKVYFSDDSFIKQIEIFTSEGKLIKSYDLKYGISKYEINLENQNSGMYLLVIKTKHGNISKKIYINK